ncbi:MAG: hypothetical protein ACI4P0_02135, partial [Mailhella sp.]
LASARWIVKMTKITAMKPLLAVCVLIRFIKSSYLCKRIAYLRNIYETNKIFDRLLFAHDGHAFCRVACTE